METRRRLIAAVAMGLAIGSTACGPAVDPDDGGDSAGATGAGSTSSPNTTTSAPNTTTGGTTTGPTTVAPPPTDSGQKLDLGDTPKFDIGTGNLDAGTGDPLCAPSGAPPACDESLGEGEVLEAFCVQLLGEQTCEGVSDEVLVDAAWDCLPSCEGFAERVACERFTLEDASCCSWVVIRPGQSCPGRPFLVDGHARVPQVVARGDWSRPAAPNLEGLDAPTRRVLARAWAADGCHEAASVASFSRFVLQLLSLGAPAQLVHRAQLALGEEVEHARAFFGLATAYGESAVGPDRLAIEGSLAGTSDPVGAAVSLATEGCIAETISATQLALAASGAEDPVVRATLNEIAEQELQHAELAWSALGWMLRGGSNEMRTAVAEAFVRAQDAVPRAVSVADGLNPATLRAVGRLTADQRLHAAERALTESIAPAAAALLRPWTRSAQPRWSAARVS